jgi:hypothetical protein
MSADDELTDLFRRARAETSDVEPPPDFAAKIVGSLGGAPQASQTARGVSPMSVELGAIGRFVVPMAAFAAAAAITLAWTAGGAADVADAELDGVEAVP